MGPLRHEINKDNIEASDIKTFLSNKHFLHPFDFLAGEVADSNGLIGIAVSYDMAWPRRNGGHNFNTGHGAVMGAHTGQVLDYGVRSKMCRTCANGKKKNHDCRKNHKGSSKNMEPDVAVDLFQRAV